MKCPLCKHEDNYIFHDNVWDKKEAKVYRCNFCDLTFLWPQMTKKEEKEFYNNYNENVKERRLNQQDSLNSLHIKSLETAKKRFDVISEYFGGKDKVCEIGSATGAFLELLHDVNYKCAVEPNPRNRKFSSNYSDIQYEYIENIPENLVFDVICMFHTFEHISKPHDFLNEVKNHLKVNGNLIIEVPYIRDPLITLYDCKEFKDFYFQVMHPYVYSTESIKFVLNKAGFKVNEFIFNQRYGLANHLTWLSRGKPGGDKKFEELFSNMKNYKNKLEENELTDTFFIIASY